MKDEDNKDTKTTAALLKLKELLIKQRDAKRAEANALSAEIRSLEKLITPEMLVKLEEAKRVEEIWRMKKPEECTREAIEKEAVIEVVEKFTKSYTPVVKITNGSSYDSSANFLKPQD